jgi:magnesium-transporting ATPase (P-type)
MNLKKSKKASKILSKPFLLIISSFKTDIFTKGSVRLQSVKSDNSLYKSIDTVQNSENILIYYYRVILSFLVCNNVTPIEDANGRTLQAASPDEISLVKFAEQIGFVLKSRDLFNIEILTPNNKVIKYKILKNFPFSSEQKVFI